MKRPPSSRILCGWNHVGRASFTVGSKGSPDGVRIVAAASGVGDRVHAEELGEAAKAAWARHGL